MEQHEPKNWRSQWLKEHTPLSSLSGEIQIAIAARIEVHPFLENQRLVLEDTEPTVLYILYQGRLERYRTRETSQVDVLSLLPGSIVHLKELLLDQRATHTVVTLSAGELWTIAKADFLNLVQQYPEISQVLSRQLASELYQIK
jgi:CRP-like cAMP-binding protein